MGGKGGSETQTVEVNLPPELEQGAKEVVAAGLNAASLPYTPNRGVTVAAFAPQQNAYRQGANQMAGAFGLPMAQNIQMREPTRSASGIMGYGSGANYDGMIDSSVPRHTRERRQDVTQGYAHAANRIYDTMGVPNAAPMLTPYPTTLAGGMDRMAERRASGQTAADPKGGNTSGGQSIYASPNGGNNAAQPTQEPQQSERNSRVTGGNYGEPGTNVNGVPWGDGGYNWK